jgi:hypothetical protein
MQYKPMSLADSRMEDLSTSIVLASFPRSGSTFFINEFESKTGIHIKRTHEMLMHENIISCIRNPKETLTSLLCMKYESIAFTKKIDIVLDEDYLFKMLESMAEYYLNFYNYLVKSENLIIEYSNFINDSEPYIKAVASYFGIKLLSNGLKLPPPKDRIFSGYLKSSKISNRYGYCLSFVKDFNIQKLEEAYQIALSKSINL